MGSLQFSVKVARDLQAYKVLLQPIQFEMNSRVPALFLALALSVFAAHGTPALVDFNFDPLEIAHKLAKNVADQKENEESDNILCYCTTTLKMAENNTYVKCPSALFSICVTELIDTEEYGTLHLRGTFPEADKELCGLEAFNYTMPNIFAPTPRIIHVKHFKSDCCETTECNN